MVSESFADESLLTKTATARTILDIGDLEHPSVEARGERSDEAMDPSEKISTI